MNSKLEYESQQNTVFLLQVLSKNLIRVEPEQGLVFRSQKRFAKNKVWIEPNSCGYLRFRMFDSGKKKWCFLHKCVWVFVNGVVPPDLVIDHIDREIEHNYISNLRLLTRAENAKNISSLIDEINPAF